MSEDENMAEAVLGKDAEEFCSSDLGRYVLGRARQEKEEAQIELAKTSPFRIFKGFELRNAIYRADSIEQWLAELINSGRIAQRNMEYGNADSEV